VSAEPEISVLVPCWNDGRFLDEALASIAAQSHRDFEAIVADDGSTDDSPAIANAWAARDQRFRVVRGEHAGMTENWNRALAAARGRFVAKLDADDAWRPELLRTLHLELDVEQPPLAAFCRAVECDESLSPIAAWHGEAAFAPAGLEVGARLELRGRDLWRRSFGEHQLWQSSAFLMRRDELSGVGGFDARWSCAADTALLLRLFAAERTFVHQPYVGVLYRRRPDSVSATFETAGWKSFEGVLVRLDALARDARRLAPLGRELRQVWWQSWRSMLEAADRPALWESMPANVRAKLEQAIRGARRPPAAVRLEGWLRLQAWRLRARSGARSSAERAA
jgi:glycosyltransferase involved in cell wall biosynthesis